MTAGDQRSSGYPASYEPGGYDRQGLEPGGYGNRDYDGSTGAYADGSYGTPGYDAAGYDAASYGAAGYDAAGYNGGGNEASGYDRTGYDDGSARSGGYRQVRRAAGRGTARSTTIRTRPRASRCRRSPTTAVRRRTGNIGAVAGVNGYGRCGCVPGPHLLPSRNTVRLEPRCAFRREATSAPVSVTKGRHAGGRSCPPAVGPLPSSCYLQSRPSPIVGGVISGPNAADGKDLRTEPRQGGHYEL